MIIPGMITTQNILLLLLVMVRMVLWLYYNFTHLKRSGVQAYFIRDKPTDSLICSCGIWNSQNMKSFKRHCKSHKSGDKQDQLADAPPSKTSLEMYLGSVGVQEETRKSTRQKVGLIDSPLELHVESRMFEGNCDDRI